MLEELPSSKFQEWLSFYELAPFGPLHEEYRMARLIAAVYSLKGVELTPAEIFETLARTIAPPDPHAEARRARLAEAMLLGFAERLDRSP
jgi:hypothetical protein